MNIGKLNITVKNKLQKWHELKYWIPYRLTMKSNPPIYRWFFVVFSWGQEGK